MPVGVRSVTLCAAPAGVYYRGSRCPLHRQSRQGAARPRRVANPQGLRSECASPLSAAFRLGRRLATSVAMRNKTGDGLADIGKCAKRDAVRSTVAPSSGKAGKARLGRVAQQTLRVCEVNEPPLQRRFAAWKSVKRCQCPREASCRAQECAKHPALRRSARVGSPFRPHAEQRSKAKRHRMRNRPVA